MSVVKDFKLEWARSYGVKDVDTKEPVTTKTLFQAGSISKPVAAMVALKRVQDGKISLEENVSNTVSPPSTEKMSLELSVPQTLLLSEPVVRLKDG